mmetsp:Transcript_9344/g.25350  ORF Transcript_9344/g.25350 Transcript_9344/m.25350 type:complete len:448 (+) Transcript_9344:1826-3169(+)
MDPEVLSASERLHEPLGNVAPLGEPLLCQADIPLQGLGILHLRLPTLQILRHGLPHDFVDPLLSHGLRQELCVVLDVQDLHLLCHHSCRRHRAETALRSVRDLVPNLLGRRAGVPQGELLGLPGLEVRDRLRVRLREVLPPCVKRESCFCSSVSHLPIVRVGHVQGVVHGAQKCVEQHPGRVGVLLPEVHARHLPEATDGAAHGGHAQQAEFHIDVAEGFRARGGEAEVSAPPQLRRQREELRAHEEAAREARPEGREELLRVQAASIVWRPCQHDLHFWMASEERWRNHRDVIHALLLHPTPDEDQDLGLRILVQATVRLQGLLGLEALLLQGVDARVALVLCRVRRVIQRHDAGQTVEKRALALELDAVVGRHGTHPMAGLDLFDVGDPCLEHVEATFERHVLPDGGLLQVEDDPQSAQGRDRLPEPVVDEVGLDDTHVVCIVEN